MITSFIHASKIKDNPTIIRMIALIRGKIINFTKSQVIIETNNIGYYVACPDSFFTKYKIGDEVSIYTQSIIQAESINLYGFLTLEEKSFFSMLINASGVGAKIAMQIISNLGLERASLAINSEDVAVLKQIPGIGEKLAKKIILDLKDKVSKEFVITKRDYVNSDSVIFALINLGYSKASAQTLVNETLLNQSNNDLSEEELLKACLKSNIS